MAIFDWLEILLPSLLMLTIWVLPLPLPLPFELVFPLPVAVDPGAVAVLAGVAGVGNMLETPSSVFSIDRVQNTEYKPCVFPARAATLVSCVTFTFAVQYS
jgi:hypothetical protein